MKHFSAPHEPILLTAPLQPHQERHWPSANKEVIWGWKRDVGSESRLVYFSGNLARDGGSVILNRYFFHLRTRIALRADLLIGDVERACARFASSGAPTALKIEKQTDLTTIEVRIGWPTEIDGERVGRLKLRRPRKRIGVPEFPKASDPLRARSMWPADLYVGSGLSYEAGLPTLCDMHEVFAVDNETSTGFMVGAADPLPRLLADEGSDRLLRFCQVHTIALLVEPTPAMLAIADLAAAGQIGRVLRTTLTTCYVRLVFPMSGFGVAACSTNATRSHLPHRAW